MGINSLDWMLVSSSSGVRPAKVVRDVSMIARKRARPALASIALREAMSGDPHVERQTNPLLGRIVALFEEGVRTGDIQPVRAEPYHFFSAVAGTILFYVAALPQFVSDLPDDYLSDERMAMLEDDAVAIAERLLGMSGPRPVPST